MTHKGLNSIIEHSDQQIGEREIQYWESVIENNFFLYLKLKKKKNYVCKEYVQCKHKINSRYFIDQIIQLHTTQSIEEKTNNKNKKKTSTLV